jgi:hypothetical protein
VQDSLTVSNGSAPRAWQRATQRSASSKRRMPSSN